MKTFLMAGAVCVLVCSTAWSGVVIEMEEGHAGSPSGASINTIYAQGETLRMDTAPEQSARMSIIFRNDTLWMVDHDEETCQTIDREGMEQLSAQLGGVMQQMEAELASLPPEQRAMMEEMMKSRMPAGMSGGAKESPPRRIEVGASEKVGEYACTVHTLFAADEKVWEVCAAARIGTAGAAQEALTAFRAMSRFAESISDTLRQGPLADMISTPFGELNGVNGFPVRVRTYERGRLTSEATLKSMLSRDLDGAVFDVPDGYRINHLADEMKRGR